MERLSDIIDQIQNLITQKKLAKYHFQRLRVTLDSNPSVRFGTSGPYQLDDVSVDIEAGSFVGVVGQSGSGKSTLMKLLPRLYEPQGEEFLSTIMILGKLTSVV